MISTPRDLITAVVVGRRLGVTPVTIYALARTGKLPAVVFGTTGGRQIVRFRPEDVDAFVRENLRGGQGAVR